MRKHNILILPFKAYFSGKQKLSFVFVALSGHFWSTVCLAGPTLTRQWINALYLLGNHYGACLDPPPRAHISHCGWLCAARSGSWFRIWWTSHCSVFGSVDLLACPVHLGRSTEDACKATPPHLGARILVQVTIYRRLLIGRDGHLDQSEASYIS